MYDIVFRGGRILAEQNIIENGCLAVAQGSIVRVAQGGALDAQCARRVVDLEGAYLSPGFIDMHTHGGGGADFMDGTVGAVVTAARMHLHHGTTTICPTSVASGDDELFAFFDAYEAAKSIKDDMPHLHGIHLEGPYFSPAQAGAQPAEHMISPGNGHWQSVLERSRGNVVRWSSAPEVPGVLALGDELRRRGILAAIAHTDADLALARLAFAHGYTLLTHFYSGMSMLRRVNGYRVLGMVEAGYLIDDMDVEIIADGIHLPGELLRLILKCKPHERIALVTDSMRAAGMPEGPSTLGSLKNEFRVIVEDGVAKMPDRSCFAGSVATADRLIRVMTREAGLSVESAVRLMTQNPARMLGIAEKTGGIAVGKAADLLVFDDDIRIREVFVDGVSCGACAGS